MEIAASKILLLGSISFFCALNSSLVSAEITPDATLPNKSIVTKDGQIFNITGGTTAGTNLFHSFKQFSILGGDTAYFNNDASITNIISRVTGSFGSVIDGSIQANGTANLFLLNPNGILFGPNASLNIGGSFVASTGSSMTFSDGFQYSAVAPQTNTLLSVNVPVGLQYGKTPQPVGVFGSFLNVQPGKTLALLGGDVILNNALLLSPGGRIELGGLADTGQIKLSFSGSSPEFAFPADTFRGDISVENSLVALDNGNTNGDIILTGDDINISGGVAFGGYTNISLSAGALALTGVKTGGNITLNAANNITISDSSIFSLVRDGFSGNGGDINITADSSLALKNGTQIGTITSGEGNAGHINISVGDLLSLDSPDNALTAIFSYTLGNATGDGGDVNIFTKNLDLRNGSQIQTVTFSQGDAGNLNIAAYDSISLDGFNEIAVTGLVSNVVGGDATINQGARQGGEINILTDLLSITDGAGISTNVFGARGNAGNINIIAKDKIDINSDIYINDDINLSSGISSSVNLGSKGNSGKISILTQSLSLTNLAQIASFLRGEGNIGGISITATDSISIDGGDYGAKPPRGIFASIDDGGNNAIDGNDKGGSLFVRTGKLSVKNGATISSGVFKGGKGNAGDITIIATDNIFLDSNREFPTTIFSSVDEGAIGNAGDIRITTGSLSLKNGSQIGSATFGEGNAGDITVNANDISLDGELVQVQGDRGCNQPKCYRPSSISSGVQGREGVGGLGQGDGGDMKITTTTLSLTNGGQIGSAIDGGIGNAGDISIFAKSILLDGSNTGEGPSGIFSSIEPNGKGTGGDITIKTDKLFIRNGATISSATFGQGNAGNIRVFANDFLSISGNNQDPNGLTSGIFTGVGSASTGKGGDIEITAPTLRITGGGGLFSNTLASKNAGNIILNLSESLYLSGDDSGIFADTGVGSTGKGGSIFIDPSVVTVRDGAAISVDSRGQGDGGNITLATGSLALDNGTISAATTSSDGGDVNLTVDDLTLLNNNSLISATAGKGGNGGNVTIDTRFLIANNNSDIFARAFQGQGGNIDITAAGIFSSPDSEISASSDFGVDGIVQLNTPGIDPSRGLEALPENVTDISKLVAQKCSASTASTTQQSEFVVTGRGGLPPNPSDPLQSETDLTGWVSLRPDQQVPASSFFPKSPTRQQNILPSHHSENIVEAQTAHVDQQGTLILASSAVSGEVNLRTQGACRGS